MENNQNTEEKTMGPENKNDISPYLMPIAVIIAGVLIAGAVLYSQNNNLNPQVAPTAGAQRPTSGGSSDNVKPVSSEDHINGNPDALVKIIEFSDIECPFCKRFHPTMERVIEEYGKDGRVAWVYRHFPLDAIHSKARIEAAATELAAEIGGNDKFWEYLAKMFEVTPSNNGLDLNLIPQIAEDVGLDRKPFEALVKEDDRRGGKFADHIEDNYQDVLASGGTGTPYTIIIAPNGKTFPITGAQPYSVVKSLIELALTEK